MPGHCQGLMPVPASLQHFPTDGPSGCWFLFRQAIHRSPHIIPKSFSEQLHASTPFSVYYVFCSLWCDTLPLAIVHVMLFWGLIFLNYTNRPVQVICPSLLFRTPAMFVSSARILSSDLKSSYRSLTKPCKENWPKLRLSFSTSLEIPYLKIPIYY